MIKKEHRLKKNKHFQYIYRKGESKQSKYLTLVFTKTHIKPFKVGFSVSKKIGKSVVRSKVKRRLREAFTQLTSHFNASYNYIFVAKSGINTIPFLSVKNEMESCLKKAKLYV